MSEEAYRAIIDGEDPYSWALMQKVNDETMNREQVSWKYEKQFLLQDYRESEESCRERIEKMLYFISRNPRVFE